MMRRLIRHIDSALHHLRLAPRWWCDWVDRYCYGVRK